MGPHRPNWARRSSPTMLPVSTSESKARLRRCFYAAKIYSERAKLGKQRNVWHSDFREASVVRWIPPLSFSFHASELAPLDKATCVPHARAKWPGLFPVRPGSATTLFASPFGALAARRHSD